MALVIADTDVMIDFLADIQPSSDKISQLLKTGQLATTVISRFELLVGAKTIVQQKMIQEFLATIPIFSLNPDASDAAAKIQQTLVMQGNPIGMADSLIAGIVQVKGAELLTRNVRHFERVKDLKLCSVT